MASLAEIGAGLSRKMRLFFCNRLDHKPRAAQEGVESPAAHFPVVVQHAEQGKPVLKVVFWSQLDDYRREPAFILDLPAGPLDAAKPRRERKGASVTGNAVSESAATRVTASDDDGNYVYASEYLVSKGRLTPIRHAFHNPGVPFYMLRAGVPGALVMGCSLRCFAVS